MFNSVAHIGFTVSNLSNSIEFYRDILGLEYLGRMEMHGDSTNALFNRPNSDAEVAYLKTADNSAALIELIHFLNQPTIKDKPDLFKTSISEFCFAIDDIDHEYARLKALGVRFISEPQMFDSTAYGFGISKAVYLYDPDGNILELIQPM